MIITLKDGDVTIALRPDLAPKHVERIKELVREGAYDNVAFHRVIDGFMAQTGDVQYGDMKDGYDADAAGTGGSRTPDLPAEFSKEPFVRGTSAWRAPRTRTPPIRSSSSCSRPAPSSNGQYTVVGKVESGMELVDKIKKGDEADNGVRHRSRPHDQGPHRRGEQVETHLQHRYHNGEEHMAEIKDPREHASSWKPPRARSSSSCSRTSRPAMSRASRNWPAKAPMTASCSTASSTASWRRPAT